MPAQGFPTALFIAGKAYRVAGEQDRTPSWNVGLVPTQPGQFEQVRIVPLGDGAAGIIGSHRHGTRPSRDGVGDVTNGDTSFEDRYGAGPAVTSIDLSTGNGFTSIGSIGTTLQIGGGGTGASSIGATTTSGNPSTIFSDGHDDNGEINRYIYTVAGGRLKVIDPVNDAVVETTEWAGVDGADSARWASTSWIARHGGPGDFVQYISSPYTSTSGTTLLNADYEARYLESGPDALYRAYDSFGGNKALLKKSTAQTKATAALDANWAPTNGETLGDPGAAVTNIVTLGERLVAGKENGVGEFDQDFTFRQYLRWMESFRWDLTGNLLIPVGQAGEMIVGYRRGLFFLPQNVGIGVEQLTGNETDKKGRYTAGCYDGNWFYVFLESLATDDTHIIKMRRRRLAGPGLFEHHPIVTLTDQQVLDCYLWPGATISGVRYGPRMYFSGGTDTLKYINLGETQPDVEDSKYRFTTGAWSITWPHDNFDSPSTLKAAYKLEANYKNVTGTDGITWAVSYDDGVNYVDLMQSGEGGVTAVRDDGFHQRFAPSSNAQRARELIFRVSGTGGSATAQQHIQGHPLAYLIEQPEKVRAYQATLELAVHELNDDDAELQWRALAAIEGPQRVTANWGDLAPESEFNALISVTRVGAATGSGAPGTLLVQAQIKTLDYADGQ